ncbi:MAG: VRR-NUC domain-containing protein [Minisyncoccia bacterium]
MLEKDVQKKSVAYARKSGWWARKFTAQGRRSVPDYVFAKSGRVIFDEFKATGGKPSELQEEEHKAMRAAGLTVWVHDDPEAFKRDLEKEDRKIGAWL